jgi:tRNA-2-methylthio-N6-dimethylallyladenosine synthase
LQVHKQGKRFGVLGCVAQQEGEKIFEGHLRFAGLRFGVVSQSTADADQIEAGKQRVTGLDDRRADECLRPSSPRTRIRIQDTSPSSKGLRQVLRLLRGSVYARQGAQPDLGLGIFEARQMSMGYRDQLLGQNVNSYKDASGKKTFAGCWRR